MWIVGRSVVIHKAAAPYDRWACANIGSAGVGATVNFPQTTGAPQLGLGLGLELG